MYGIVEGVESLANDVTRMPVTVSAEWHSTPVTTDPPRTAQHLEWRVTFLLRAPEPIYVAALLTHGGEMHWGLKIDEPAREVELRATFSPWRFRTSEGVQVDFEGRRTRVTDAALKQDARDVATISAPASTRTGEITEVLSMPGHAITLAFVAFAQADTETRRLGRWQVRAEVVAHLSANLAPLASGYQTGTVVA